MNIFSLSDLHSCSAESTCIGYGAKQRPLIADVSIGIRLINAYKSSTKTLRISRIFEGSIELSNADPNPNLFLICYQGEPGWVEFEKIDARRGTFAQF